MLNDRRLIPVLLALTAVAFLIFGLWPGIDLAVAGHFHDVTGFPISQNLLIETLRRVFWDLSIVVPLLALGLLAASWFGKGRALGLPLRIWAYIVVLFVSGPGLLVNAGLKSYWGRARPTEITEFGGAAHFTPFYQVTDQCAKNCSFVSGEGAGSMAMAITALLILACFRERLGKSTYRLGQALTLLMLGFVGLQRVASGGHFLSDVVLSWLFTALVAAILARFMLPSDVAPGRPSA